MRDKLIKEIYNEMISTVLKKSSKLATNYLKYLYEMYGDKDVNGENYERVKQIILKIESNTWNGYDDIEKETVLTIDSALETIYELSNQAYNYAKNKVDDKPSISPDEAKKIIIKLSKELNNVQKENMYEAEKLVSEATLDLKYACGSITDTSIRYANRNLR